MWQSWGIIPSSVGINIINTGDCSSTSCLLVGENRVHKFPIKTNTKQQKFCHWPPTPTPWHALSATFSARDLDKLGALGHVYRPRTPDVLVSLNCRKSKNIPLSGYPSFHGYTCATATHRNRFAIPELMQFSCLAPHGSHGQSGYSWWSLLVEVAQKRRDSRSSACAWFVNGRFTARNGKNYEEVELQRDEAPYLPNVTSILRIWVESPLQTQILTNQWKATRYAISNGSAETNIHPLWSFHYPTSTTGTNSDR